MMDNQLIQSILASLIATVLIVIGKRLLADHYSRRQAIVSVGVASAVFLFGSVLQPAVQFFIEGDNPLWSLLRLLREQAPGYFVLGLLVGGLLPGILTGLAVLKGDTFKQRVAYGMIWAPLSLTVFDALQFYEIWDSPIQVLRAVGNWNNVYFTLLSNLVGGAVGGLLIGAALHMYIVYPEAPSKPIDLIR